eukprot:11061335-Alexandrium_andersonii.AAC.1
MSASLVGSEMCIRDRSSAPPPSSASTSIGSTANSGRAAASRLRRIGTVSYTHLTLPTICSV